MPDLAAFQQAFAEALMTDEQPAAVLRAQAFAVYRNTVTRGTVEALRAGYPTIDALLGTDMFTDVALDYRRETPPKGPVLSDYGADFAGFLARQPWTSELPYLADVARLDRLWLESVLASDAVAPPGHVAGVFHIALHPATRFAWLSTPALTIWQAHRDGFDELDPEWCEEGALFTRQCLTVRAERIDRATHGLLIACSAPARLDDLVGFVAHAFPEADVPALLQRCVASGALIIQS